MKYKYVIFDFNGTLYWDTHLHNEAWNRFLEKHLISNVRPGKKRSPPWQKTMRRFFGWYLAYR